MQELDQRDRELLNALQGEIPLVSTPFAVIGQMLDMSEKDVLKRTERLRRDGFVRHIAAHFDSRALGYRSCLVAARVDEDRVDHAAAVIGAHPGVTQNYRRNNALNLWFTLCVSPSSRLGLERTIEVLGREAGCEAVRPLPTLKHYKTPDGDFEHETTTALPPLTALEIDCIRLLQQDLPLQPRPFELLARGSNVSGDELLATVKTLVAQGRIRRVGARGAKPRGGISATAMGVWVVPQDRADEYAAMLSKHRAVSHCYLRPTYPDWPYNVYTTVHGRSVDECESIVNDLVIDTGLTERQVLYPTKEYKRSRLNLFTPDEEAWEDTHAAAQEAVAG